jgi:hypothetical protein
VVIADPDSEQLAAMENHKVLAVNPNGIAFVNADILRGAD